MHLHNSRPTGGPRDSVEAISEHTTRNFDIMNIGLVRLDHTSGFLDDRARSTAARVITVAILLITSGDICLSVDSRSEHESRAPWIMYLGIITLGDNCAELEPIFYTRHPSAKEARRKCCRSPTEISRRRGVIATRRWRVNKYVNPSVRNTS